MMMMMMMMMMSLLMTVLCCSLLSVPLTATASSFRQSNRLQAQREEGKSEKSEVLDEMKRHLESSVDVTHITSLYPSKEIPYHWFGEAVMVNDNMAIIGAPGTEDFSNFGSAYVFRRERTGLEWKLVTVLEPGTKGIYDSFGETVSIYRGCAVVGAPKDDSGGTDSGAVYAYAGDSEGSSKSWGLSQVLKPNDLSMQDYFGSAISQYKCRHVLVGAWGADASFVSQGAAYVYIFANNKWILEEKLTPGDSGSAYQWFGISVGLAEDVAVVGAWGDSTAGSQAGSVYIYRHSDGGGWHFIQREFGTQGSNFGYSLSIQGGMLAVGAPNSYRTSMGNSNNVNALRTGMVYIYRMRDFNHFEFDEYVQCDICDGNNRFGKAVALSGGNKYGYRLLVGESQQIHLLERSGNGRNGKMWESMGYLESGYDVDSSFFYGSAISISGRAMMIGVKDHTSSSAGRFVGAGAVVVMDADDGTDIDIDAVYNSFHVNLYICLYVAIVAGLAVILIVPLGMFVQYILHSPNVVVDKNQLRENRSLLDGGKKKPTLK